MGCIITVQRDDKHACCITFDSDDTIGHLMMAKEIINICNRHRQDSNAFVAGCISEIPPFSGLGERSFLKLRSLGIFHGNKKDPEWKEGVVVATPDEIEEEKQRSIVLNRTKITLNMDKNTMEVKFPIYMNVLDYHKAESPFTPNILPYELSDIPFIEIDDFCKKMSMMAISRCGNMDFRQESEPGIVYMPIQYRKSLTPNTRGEISIGAWWKERSFFPEPIYGLWKVRFLYRDGTDKTITAGPDMKEGIIESYCESCPAVIVNTRKLNPDITDIILILSLDSGAEFSDIKNLAITWMDYPAKTSPMLYDGNPKEIVVAMLIREKWRWIFLPMGRNAEPLP